MKKIVALALCLILLLVGCGTSTDEVPTGTVQPTASQPVTVGQTEATVETESSVPEVANITETVLVDELGVKITAKSIDYDDWYGPAIKLLIENNTDTGLTVQCRNASVNGYMVDTLISCDVASGKKANDELTIYKSSLEQCGIDTIADIEFTFHIFTTDGWDDFLDTDPITIKTSAADTYNYTYDDSGDLLYQENGITVVSKGLYDDEDEHGVLVYICNESGFPITAQIRDLSVNGFMVNSIFSPDIANGKHAISKIKFSDSSLKENDITEIEDVEFSFHIFDSNDWRQTFDSDVITITKSGVSAKISETVPAETAEAEIETFTVGNLTIPVKDGQTYNEEDQSLWLLPGKAGVIIVAVERTMDLPAVELPLFRSTIEQNISVAKKESVTFPILGESIPFDMIQDTNDLFWLVGAFCDDDYDYCITLAFDGSEDATDKFSNFVFWQITEENRDVTIQGG